MPARRGRLVAALQRMTRSRSRARVSLCLLWTRRQPGPLGAARRQETRQRPRAAGVGASGRGRWLILFLSDGQGCASARARHARADTYRAALRVSLVTAPVERRARPGSHAGRLRLSGPRGAGGPWPRRGSREHEERGQLLSHRGRPAGGDGCAARWAGIVRRGASAFFAGDAGPAAGPQRRSRRALGCRHRPASRLPREL